MAIPVLTTIIAILADLHRMAKKTKPQLKEFNELATLSADIIIEYASKIVINNEIWIDANQPEEQQQLRQLISCYKRGVTTFELPAS